MIKLLYKFLFLVLILTLSQCRKAKKTAITKPIQSTIKYAKGFDIIEENGNKVLVMKKVFQSSNQQFKLILSNRTNIATNTLKVPVEKVILTSTPHVAMLESLNCEHTIIGYSNTKYVSSSKTRKLIDSDKIAEIGSEQNMNTEKLMSLSPDLVVGFSLHPNNKVYENIKRIGIPVVYFGEWLEETPLGRAEWIKFFGVLFNKEKQADSIFNSVEKNYLAAKKLAKKNNYPPTILAGNLFKDVWYVPAGNSYKASFFKDANLNYLWNDTKGTGSLPLNLENVLEKAKNADYWLGCGMAATKKQLLGTNKHYSQFAPFKSNTVYTIASKKGPTGGLIYYEQSPIHPDLVLKDLIKITQPDVLPNYQLTFFEKIK